MVVRELCWVQNRSFGATTLHKPTTFCGAAQVEYFVFGQNLCKRTFEGQRGNGFAGILWRVQQLFGNVCG